MVDFAGWHMPVQYGSIIDEHQATRNAVGVFDVSHMGRFYFSNLEALAFLDQLTTRRVNGMGVGRIRYSMMMNASGGIQDDVLVYHLQSGEQPFCFMVVNASNREKIHRWLQQKGDLESLGFEDRTQDTAMIAIQGPLALQAVAPLMDQSPAELKYYMGRCGLVGGVEAIISRTGYTGEDGCEVTVANEHAPQVWQQIMDKVQPLGGRAVGLGARDTLRLEAAMPLYGHELEEDINPVQADVGFAINLKDREFVGKAEILAARQDPSLTRRVGLELEGRRAAREHCKIFDGDREVGEVTSGTFSPTLQKAISMGFVAPEFAAAGTSLEIDIRGKRQKAVVVELPFYKRS